MELNIPGVHGPGDSILYFVDSFRDFSIYDVDFRPIPGAPPVAAFVAVATLVAALTVATCRETYRTPMAELGERR